MLIFINIAMMHIKFSLTPWVSGMLINYVFFANLTLIRSLARHEHIYLLTQVMFHWHARLLWRYVYVLDKLIKIIMVALYAYLRGKILRVASLQCNFNYAELVTLFPQINYLLWRTTSRSSPLPHRPITSARFANKLSCTYFGHSFAVKQIMKRHRTQIWTGGIRYEQPPSAHATHKQYT